MWAGIVGISAVAAAVGFWIASAAGTSGILVQAFAAGALLTMIIDMTWDGGMVAIAVLMLASGLIMTRSRSM
jgi:hypothetical protein